jgi:uncharacterized protein YukJ
MFVSIRGGADVPLRSYGVLTGRALDRRREGSAETPHYELHLVDLDGTSYRAAVNVQSQEPPSELLYLVDDDLQHPVTAALDELGPGWHQVESRPGGAALDFIRANLFDPARMRSLPPDVAGPDNDLADLIDHYVKRAIVDTDATLAVFGDRWGPDSSHIDHVFGFRPGNGVHDVHMNQGNADRFADDNGVWQDGALLINFPAESRWIGIFLAFQSQAWHTHDETGHSTAGAPARPDPGAEAVLILAAMVNPAGPAPERETVLLLNASPEPVDLSGWRIADRRKRTCPVPAAPLAAGATLQVALSDGVRLGREGGSLTLLDAGGLKVTGVSYTEAQARREGWTVAF